MNILGCLHVPSTGSYELDGESTAGLDRDALADIRNRKIGFVFQGFNLLARTFALENVELPLPYDRSRRQGTARDLALAALQRVGLVSPVIFAGAHLQGGAGNWRTAINGVSLDYPAIRDWGVVSGSFSDATDVRVARKVAVLGATVARTPYPDQDPVGQEIQIRNVPFKIIVVLAPYTTVQTRLAGRQFILADPRRHAGNPRHHAGATPPCGLGGRRLHG